MIVKIIKTSTANCAKILALIQKQSYFYLDDWLHVVGVDESLLLPLAGDEGDPADGDHLPPAPLPQLHQHRLDIAAQLLDTVVLRLRLHRRGMSFLTISAR